MQKPLSAGDLITLAIGVEKLGIAYYDVMARSTQHKVAADLFRHLADMERQHVEIFQNMALNSDYKLASRDISEAHRVYIQSLINTAVFTDEMAADELAAHNDNEEEAINIAISVEKDSILFYYNLTEILPDAAIETIRKIIHEEKVHLTQLSGLKQVLLNLK